MRELLEYGGPVLWLQAVLGFLAVVFVIERLLYFHGVRINAPDFLLGISNHVRRKAFAEAIHEAGRTPGPVGRVAHSVLIRHHMDRSDLCEIAEEAVSLEIPRIEKNIRGVLAVALLAPLAGLLGTALGLIDVFTEIDGQGGEITHAGMAEGIFQCLITTAAGLCIATGAYIFYLALHAKARRLLHRLQRTGIEVVNLIVDSRADREIVSFQDELEARSRTPEQKAERKGGSSGS